MKVKGFILKLLAPKNYFKNTPTGVDKSNKQDGSENPEHPGWIIGEQIYSYKIWGYIGTELGRLLRRDVPIVGDKEEVYDEDDVDE